MQAAIDRVMQAFTHKVGIQPLPSRRNWRCEGVVGV